MSSCITCIDMLLVTKTVYVPHDFKLNLDCLPCRLISAHGLPSVPKAAELSRLREQVMAAKDQLLQLDLAPLTAGNASQPRRPRNAAARRMLHMCA